jgi:hypothetical protein
MRSDALNIGLRKADIYGCGNLQMDVMKAAAQSECILKAVFLFNLLVLILYSLFVLGNGQR